MSRRLSSLLVFLLFGALVTVAIIGASGTASSNDLGGTLTNQGRTFEGQVVQRGSSSHAVAIVPISGEITSGSSAVNGATTGSEDTIALLEAIRRSGDYDGVIMEVDTPGGGVLASAEIADEVRRVQRDGIKVVSWMRNTAASGGYYISADADRIVASPETITGSIGVILGLYDASGLADKVGVQEVNITSGKLKDMGTPFKKLSPEARAVLQELVDESYSTFVGVVSRGRDIDEEEVRKLADGRIYTGTQALELDLVDELGMRRDAYDAMGDLVKGVTKGSQLDIVSYSRRYGFFDALSSGTVQHLRPSDLAQIVGDGVAGIGTGAAPYSGSGAALPVAGDHSGGVRLEYRMELS